jgi:hypothetical protein
MTSSEGFQQHFSIICKLVCCGFYVVKNVAFTLISFAVLKCDACLSVHLPFELSLQIPVHLLLELEVNLLDQNVYELEFELSRMKAATIVLKYCFKVQSISLSQFNNKFIQARYCSALQNFRLKTELW